MQILPVKSIFLSARLKTYINQYFKGEKQEKGMHNMSSMESQIDSQAFARLYLDRVQLLMANEKSNQLCKINVAMHSFRLQDLFESDEIRSSECYLLRSGSNIRPNQKLAHVCLKPYYWELG